MKFECRKAPSRCVINRLDNKFRMTGSSCNKMGIAGEKKSVRTQENVRSVELVLTQGPRSSIKQLSQQLNLGVLSASKII